MAKRLIDRDEMVDNFKATKVDECFPNWKDMSPEARAAVIRCSRAWREIILNQPTVDAVEVVRCKDCKHWKHFDHLGCTDFVKVCGLANYMIGANGYCLYGERRADNADD